MLLKIYGEGLLVKFLIIKEKRTMTKNEETIQKIVNQEVKLLRSQCIEKPKIMLEIFLNL